MNQMVTVLHEIAQTVYKTQETLKTTASFTESPGDSRAGQLSILLEKIKISSILTAFEIVHGIDKTELRESIQVIMECVEPGEKLYASLKDNFPDSVAGNLQEQLDKNMQSLGLLLVQLGSM